MKEPLTTKDSKIAKTIGNILKKSRDQRKWSQEELAAISHLSIHAISDAENGKTNFGIITFYKLVRALRISTDQIFFPRKKPASIEKQKIDIELMDCDKNELRQLRRIIEASKISFRVLKGAKKKNAK